MPIHDWTRVGAGTFHDFHCGWVVEICNALNVGLLPPGYYARAEQVGGEVGPDVLTLQVDRPQEIVATTEVDQYARRSPDVARRSDLRPFPEHRQGPKKPRPRQHRFAKAFISSLPVLRPHAAMPGAPPGESAGSRRRARSLAAGRRL